ncbi:hypothetical protein LXM94_25820, partial [Rhizobium sp. TRM95111]|uniref:hypothetical protein n=1 Tax=Rhizobium alarense TaxID=2846851 RepID=UPI001F22B40D
MTEDRTLETRDYYVIGVVLSSVLYNCVLATINANVMPLGFAHVALTEILILLAGLVFILRKGLYEEDLGILAFAVFTLAMAIYMSALNRMVFIDYFRNVLIIFCFAALGTWVSRATVRTAFKWACGLVLGGLLLEIFLLDLYGTLFYPMSYFENTRGLEQVSFDGSKLFQNVLRIPGRFSFGIIDHRAASIFLEQVSLANFCGVLLIFLTCFWTDLRLGERMLFLVTVVLILLTNDSRTMLMFSFVCLAGYFVFPRIPTAWSLLYMPLVLALGFVVYMLRPDASGDTLDGRVVLTVRHILEIDLFAVLGLEAAKAAQFADSGYVYVVYGGTVFGLVLFWLFVCLFPAGRTPEQRRFAHLLSVFL